MSPLALAIGSIAITLGLILLYTIEHRRGKRFVPRVRHYSDRIFSRMREETIDRIPEVNREFFRHIFHYFVHRILSRFLRFLERMERGVRAVVRLNRKVAIERRTKDGGGESHLQAIAEHKEQSALSEEEKIARKMAAIGENGTPAANLRRRVKR